MKVFTWVLAGFEPCSFASITHFPQVTQKEEGENLFYAILCSPALKKRVVRRIFLLHQKCLGPQRWFQKSIPSWFTCAQGNDSYQLKRHSGNMGYVLIESICFHPGCCHAVAAVAEYLPLWTSPPVPTPLPGREFSHKRELICQTWNHINNRIQVIWYHIGVT